MLSDDLEKLKTWFDATRLPGNAMNDSAAEAFSLVLGELATRAANLERDRDAAIDDGMFADIGALGLSPETETVIRAARAICGAANVVMLHAAHPLVVVSPNGGDAA